MRRKKKRSGRRKLKGTSKPTLKTGSFAAMER